MRLAIIRMTQKGPLVELLVQPLEAGSLRAKREESVPLGVCEVQFCEDLRA